MRKKRYTVLAVVLALLLCACMGDDRENVPTMQPHTEAETIQPTADVPETTVPAHTPLYLPQYTPEQIRQYFAEVVLNMEYSDGAGDITLVQKWTEPIRYRIFGNPTQADMAALRSLFAQLNEIPGFPGIFPADHEAENLTIRFMDPDAFFTTYSSQINGEDAYGAAQFWYYTDTNEIYSANVGYRMDVDQDTRLSVLVEEIVNMLGISDTELREDSVVYQYSNENTALSDVDWLILKLLYDPAIQCGMNEDQCRQILQRLYY